MRHEITLNKTPQGNWIDKNNHFYLCSSELNWWFYIPNQVTTIYIIITKTHRKESIHLKLKEYMTSDIMPAIFGDNCWNTPFTFRTDTDIKRLLKRLKITECYITIESE